MKQILFLLLVFVAFNVNAQKEVKKRCKASTRGKTSPGS